MFSVLIWAMGKAKLINKYYRLLKPNFFFNLFTQSCELLFDNIYLHRFKCKVRSGSSVG